MKVVTEVEAVMLNFKHVQDGQVHSLENPLDLSQLLPQPTVDESSVSNLLQKVVFVSKLLPKDVSVQRVVSPYSQTFSDNLRTEVIDVAAVELVAEDVVVVVAHCHTFCFDDKF